MNNITKENPTTGADGLKQQEEPTVWAKYQADASAYEALAFDALSLRNEALRLANEAREEPTGWLHEA